MSVKYIIDQAGGKIGLSPSVASQRTLLTNYLNRAARELYNSNDSFGILVEEYFKVNANQTITFPEGVGHLRAMREASSQVMVNLSQMRPRYNQFNWADGWRNWRIKGTTALQTAILNQSTLTLRVKAVETPPVSVTLTGSIEGAAVVSETVVMDAVEKETVNAFYTVDAFTKDAVSQYDVILLDADDNQLSKLANNHLSAKFQIIDISSSPWATVNLGPDAGWIEVLYKKTLPELVDDHDEYPVQGLDDVLYNKMMQLYYEDSKDVSLATSYYLKARQLLADFIADATRGTNDVVAMVENPHDVIQNRSGFGRDYRFAWWRQGR